MSIKLDIGNLFQRYDLSGSDSFTAEHIERLESLIEQCNQSEAQGTELVADAIYDKMVSILKEVNPDSELLQEVWTEAGEQGTVDAERLAMLQKYPMKSINTCKSYDCAEYKDFLSRLPQGNFQFHYSFKENGHGIGLAYRNGYLVNATSRGRGLEAGLDRTRQVKLILGEYNDALKDIPFIEIRGEIVLPFDNFEYAKANYNPSLVSAFTGVSSMFCDSATDDMVRLLQFRAYHCFADGLYFRTKTEEYAYLTQVGFTVPMSAQSNIITKDMADSTIREDMAELANLCDNFGGEGIRYPDFTDGVVVEVDNKQMFSNMGGNSKYNYGNVAMKVGRWEQNILTGFVQAILWSEGKTKLSPVALVSEGVDDLEYSNSGYSDSKVIAMRDGEWVTVENMDTLGVMTQSGQRVKRIPLYEPKNIKILQAYVGNALCFRYGGEAGVVPCYPDGTLLTDTVKEVFEEDNSDTFGYY